MFFAKGISPGQNGDELFWERNFMQPMGRPKHAQRCLVFFLLSLGGGRGRIFFHFSLVPMCSNYVTTKFSMGSQYVPQAPNLFPNIFSIPPPFYRTCFGKCCPPFTYIGRRKGRNSILQNRTIYFGEPPWFHFF